MALTRNGTAESGQRKPRPTPREMDVLVGIARGGYNKEIARWLGVSRKRVEALVASLRLKLGASSRAQLLLRALEGGWLSIADATPEAPDEDPPEGDGSE
jgi:DNA-binding NarL/FixJ family response regulator